MEDSAQGNFYNRRVVGGLEGSDARSGM